MEAPEYYVNFVPHADRIDLDKPVFHRLVVHPQTDEEIANARLAADEVTAQLIGRETPWYYSQPEFLVEGGRMHAVLIERQILQGLMRDNWWKESRYGDLGYIHGLRLIKAMAPQVDITPSLADLAYLSDGAFGHDIKGIHSVGAQNMLKSYSSRLISMKNQFVFGKTHYTITSTPTKEAAKDTAFGDVKEIFDLICEDNPLITEDGQIVNGATWLWDEADVSQSSHIYFFREKGEKGGWMENRALKRKIKGAKGAKSEMRVGIQEVDIDEINEVENISKFTDNLANMRGNPQFQLRTSQNPESETDSGGILCSPRMWGNWGYSSYDEVRAADPIIWPTDKFDIVYRFDGHRCLNILLGKTVYPYMFDVKRRDKLERENGENSSVYWSQARAMFSGESSNDKLLSMSQFQSSRWSDEHFTISKIHGMSMGIDPAHSGGGDKAVISVLMWADTIVRHPDGQQEKKRMIIADHPLISVVYRNNFKWDPHGADKTGDLENDWWAKFVAAGGDINSLTIGGPVTYEQQICIEAATIANRLGIPRKNIWFDFSMRAGMVTAVRSVLGYEPVGIDASEKPRGFNLQFTGKSTIDRARSATQECILLMVDVVQMKKFRVRERAHSMYRTALEQLTRRGVNHRLKGNPPESKNDYMAHNGNKSPNESDAVSLAIGAAYSAGFRAESDLKESVIKKAANRLPLRAKHKLWFS